MRIVLVKLELKEQNDLLRRIAEALERRWPPLKARDEMARKSDISDLMVVDAATQRQINEIEAEVARAWDCLPGSEAYEKNKKIFEDAVRAESGQGGVDDLPWNRLRRKK